MRRACREGAGQPSGGDPRHLGLEPVGVDVREDRSHEHRDREQPEPDRQAGRDLLGGHLEVDHGDLRALPQDEVALGRDGERVEQRQ